MFVASELIRALEGPGSPSKSSAPSGGVFREGMKVEARFRGKLRYYPGVIRRENRDGTFDIDYDDVSFYILFHFLAASSNICSLGREGNVCCGGDDSSARRSRCEAVCF
jgi:hypothetical protein